MFCFNDATEPSLYINGKWYTGISMLEILESILQNPEQYPALDNFQVQDCFDALALFHQRKRVPTLGFKPVHPQAVLPSKRIIDVGYDVTIISIHKSISDQITMFETGVALDIPVGYYVELVPRSSISKTGYMLANSVGIIDPGYTGTIKVPLIKIATTMPDLELPVCIAQLILKPYVVSRSVQIDMLAETTRGDGGFGSTDQRE